LLNLVGSSILGILYLIDDARTNKNQLYSNIQVLETKSILKNTLEYHQTDPQTQKELIMWYDVIFFIIVVFLTAFLHVLIYLVQR